MVTDYLTEYAKLLDWYISEYPDRDITLGVNNRGDKVEFSITVEMPNGNKFYTANSIDLKFIKTTYWGVFKKNILTKGKRAILEMYERLEIKE